MYGCFNSYIIYGWKEGNRDSAIDPEWFYDYCPDGIVQVYASDVIRNHIVEAIYGAVCQIDPDTGQLIISDDYKSTVNYLYLKVIESLKKNGSSEDGLPKLGY